MNTRLIILAVLLFSIVVYPQSLNNKIQSRLNQQKDTPEEIFSRIEEGFSLGDVEKFSEFFSSQTYASLASGVSGYYSSNQFYYILQNYFSIYKPISFRAVNSNSNIDNPYISGYYKFESKGIRGTAMVFISLKLFGSHWKISQITIN